MPATTLSHRMFEPIALTLGTVDELMDAIYTMCTSTLDVNGDALPSPLVGVGRQGTTEAVYGGYTGGSSGVKFLIGADGVTSPTMRSPDSATPATQTYVGVAKDAGAFTTWTAAAPFTSGAWSAYWRGLDVGTGTLYGWLSEETLFLQRITAAGGNGRALAVGSWLDVGVDTPPIAEADFTISGMWVGDTTPPVGWLYGTSIDGAGYVLNHSTGNGQAHGMIWDGGVGVTTARERIMRPSNWSGPTVYSFTTSLADIILLPVPLYQQIGGYGVGSLRNAYLGPRQFCGQVLQVGGVDFAYFVTPSTVTPADSIVLKR